MSNQFKCGLRRFDGHGTNTYRPTNPQQSAETQAKLAKMRAERDLQDGLWARSDGGECAGGDKPQQTMKVPDREMPNIASQTSISSHESLPPWLVQSRVR